MDIKRAPQKIEIFNFNYTTNDNAYVHTKCTPMFQQ